MESIEFNTGREYTPEGQKIVAYKIGTVVKEFDGETYEKYLVYFCDKSRHISELVEVLEFDQRSIMRRYDVCKYYSVYDDNKNTYGSIDDINKINYTLDEKHLYNRSL